MLLLKGKILKLALKFKKVLRTVLSKKILLIFIVKVQIVITVGTRFKIKEKELNVVIETYYY